MGKQDDPSAQYEYSSVWLLKNLSNQLKAMSEKQKQYKKITVFLRVQNVGAY